MNAPSASAGVGHNERAGGGGITRMTEAGANLHTRGQAIVNNKLVSGADYREGDNLSTNLTRDFT